MDRDEKQSLKRVFLRPMSTLANAKINIGLQILEKLPDGFHSIRSVFYPISLHDTLDLSLNGEKTGLILESTGLPIPGEPGANLCKKAYELVNRDYPLPGVHLRLHKSIPMGAGLGGGSSDAAFFIRLLNQQLELGISWGEMHHYAKQLGSDCSFFVTNRPAFVTGKGEEMESMAAILKGYFIVLVYPGIHIGTREAYGQVTPAKARLDLETFVSQHPPAEWKEVVENDFEKTLFPIHPALSAIKQNLYNAGALYASMTGSGSALYGIFKEAVALKSVFTPHFVWQGVLN
jgi:4-diphosphocytidyl-2-C-methyl-D-erythritol kinase